MRSTLGLFGVLLALWLFASGHYTPLLVGFGLLSCGLVVLLARSMGIVDAEAVPLHLLPRALAYLPWFVLEVAKANLDVARRILHPRLPISPCVFPVRPSQRSDLGRVLYANSITMTPGTVSILVRHDAITVHAIARTVARSLEGGEMDARVSTLEGRGARPDGGA